MAYNYKLHCGTCKRYFLAYGKRDRCTHCASYNSSFVEDVLETAVDAATAYVAFDIAGDVIDGALGLIGSLFD